MKCLAEITTKGAESLIDSVFTSSQVGIITTEHPQSSYAQPVILAAAHSEAPLAVLDYAQIAALYLFEESDDLQGWGQRDSTAPDKSRGVSLATWHAVQHALGPFGIRVTRKAHV